ncbi:sigma-54-dependent Fis family transcriptional regulator [uncultured Desulfovibrio sp.]|uniref:sigma-54 interaction domain-containing protein n=1 Tax=uncultured Desulfovibrio sp. TaxID=167968 RepID=UPI002083AB62|nr:sigma 54-interacting transcriptional regulator [uncultured Desulfovibrio sp.]GKG93631.1 sigma-54-dependent Fis family transcriptional regulator [Desulfovibrionaceae bacterium]GKI12183.1 sigma-54-dependent Fis family transcriptional regulator [Desulfovibrionaceae bacterium]
MSPFTKNSEMTSLILDSLPMGVLFCDMDYIIRFVNKAYADLLGRRPEELLGCDITEIIPHSRARVVLRDGRAEMGELCQLGPGNALPVVVNRIPVRDGQGRLAGMVSQAIFNDPEELKKLSSKIDHLGHTLNQYKRRIKASLAPQYSLRSILGESAPMRRLKQQVRSYAQLDAPVLILGATGAGKELFAHALHTESPRAEGPLVSINCAAIPKDLFESELFGYARGAFSGAHQDGKIGQIELADKGTLFLDEIGEMPPEIQAKLLRVLESRSVCRVGSVNARNVDFRLVAATNRNISAMLSAGSFREDLYYRINTFVLEIPPLCERADDILPIARYVLSRMGLEHLAFAPEAEAAMLAFSWPGNVRQLHNAVVHAATMRHGDMIQVDDFPPDTLPSADLPLRAVAAGDLSDIMADTEAVVIRKVLAEQGGNVSRTARTLHIARATLYEKLRKYGISRRGA